jgi:hypothetical protein
MTRIAPVAATLLAAIVLAACSGTSTPSRATTATAAPTAEPTDEPVAEVTVAPPPPKATSYAKPAARDWAKIVKAPDNYIGKGYVVWACITQFDAATGTDSFRADASYKNLGDSWYTGDNSLFNGTTDQLSDFVTDDIVEMNVTSLGSYSYDTQAGGNTTVPLFQVDKITRKGSCA